jgi:phosphohistidine swiveling domain-containing protein
MHVIEGKSGAWNYTIGPAYIWRGTESIDEVNALHMPVVVVAHYIPAQELARLELTRIYGFVIEHAALGDPTVVFYSHQHRATVIGASGALEHAVAGEPVVVDGVEGKVFFQPDEATLARYQDLRRKDLPPEPDGLADEMMEIAQDIRNVLKFGDAGKVEQFDALGMKAAMDTLVKMFEHEPLSKSDIAKLDAICAGTPVEENLKRNLAIYQDEIAGKIPPEEGELVGGGAGAAAGGGNRIAERSGARAEGAGPAGDGGGDRDGAAADATQN